MPRKRIITSLKGANAVPKWMCLKLAGTLMQARIDYEKEMKSRDVEDQMAEQDFGEFVEDRFVEMYGLKKVAHEHLRESVSEGASGSFFYWVKHPDGSDTGFWAICSTYVSNLYGKPHAHVPGLPCGVASG